MGSKVISFGLSESEIDRAIGEVAAFRTEFLRKCAELTRRVAEQIARHAQSGFDGAVSDDLTEQSGGPRKASVSVTVEDRGGYYAVVASGSDAVWVEFGAGVFHNGPAGSSPNPFAANVTGVPNAPIAIGTFGENGTRKTWGFYENGQLIMTHGTPAAMPMYHAVRSAARDIAAIAMGVFV